MNKRVEKNAISFFTAAMIAALCCQAIASEKEASSIPEFKEVPFPMTDTEKRAVSASPEVTVDGKTFQIGFNTILRSGNKVGGGTFGLLMDQNGKAVKNKDGSVISDNYNSRLTTIIFPG